MMRVLDLFSGIGGFSLGLERAGMETVGFCEIDPFCRAVLRKHWPNVWQHEEIRTLTIDAIQSQCGSVDLVCGGVPCQPASVAGKRLGAKDDRWLWPDFLRIVRGVRPRWVIAENVPGFLALGDESEAVFRDLEQAGYTVWPLVVGADDVGAPHRRKRLWIVANRRGIESERRRVAGIMGGPSRAIEADGEQRERLRDAADDSGQANRMVYHERDGRRVDQPGRGPDRRTAAGGAGEASGEGLADSESVGRQEQGDINGGLAADSGETVADSHQPGPPKHPRLASDDGPQRTAALGSRWPARPGERQHEWEESRLVKFEQQVGAPAPGLPVKLARFANRNALRATGNAVIPAVVQCIGQAILEIEKLT